jgi:copper(I)-binding protein
MRLGIGAVRAFHLEEAMVRVTRLRLIEIGVAVVLTMAALLFVAWTAWAASPETISVTEAWARPTIGKGRTTAAYMTLTNTGQTDDVLKAAKSQNAASVEVHETKMTDEGVMQMRPLEEGLPIAAGGTAVLKPGGLHVMVLGLAEAIEEGDELPLTLEFANAGPVEIMVPVRKGAGGGHAHH